MGTEDELIEVDDELVDVYQRGEVGCSSLSYQFAQLESLPRLQADV